MHLGNSILGKANFSFDFFSKSGFIGFCCSNCKTIIKMDFNFFTNGICFNDAKKESEECVDFLLKNNLIARDVERFKILNLNAEYAFANCKNCNQENIAVFGIGELQPGREEIILKGIWEIKYESFSNR